MAAETTDNAPRVTASFNLGPMPAGRAMETLDERIVRAPVAHDVQHRQERRVAGRRCLSHYRLCALPQPNRGRWWHRRDVREPAVRHRELADVVAVGNGRRRSATGGAIQAHRWHHEGHGRRVELHAGRRRDARQAPARVGRAALAIDRRVRGDGGDRPGVHPRDCESHARRTGA